MIIILQSSKRKNFLKEDWVLHNYRRRKVFHQTDKEIIEIDAQIKKKKKKGILPDPNVPTDENGNPIEDPNMMGATPMDMDIDASSTEVTDPVDLEGGAI